MLHVYHIEEPVNISISKVHGFQMHNMALDEMNRDSLYHVGRRKGTKPRAPLAC